MSQSYGGINPDCGAQWRQSRLAAGQHPLRGISLFLTLLYVIRIPQTGSRGKMGGRSEAASSPLISPFLLFPLLCCLYLSACLLSILFPLSVLPVCFTLFRLFPCESRASLPYCRSVFLCFSSIYLSLYGSCTEALLRHLSQYSLKQIKEEV